MNKQDFVNAFKSIPAKMSKNSPAILTGIGIAGMVGTTVMAVKATPKAVKLIEAKKAELEEEKLHPIDVVKATWKCYIPAAVTGVASVACLIGACSINARRNAALITAYNLSKTALDEYKEKVIETIGEKKEKDIKDKIAQDRIDKDPVSNHEVIITERGNTLCYDAVFGRYFRSDRDIIERAINKINREIVAGDMYASLNDFYNEVGLPPIKIGDDLGWNLDDGRINIDYSSHLAEDGTPCLAIGFTVAPKYEYLNFL